MQEQIPIKVPHYPRIIGQLMHSNQFLKVFSTIAMLIALSLVTLLCNLMTRDPTVIPVSEGATELAPGQMPSADLEITRATEKYLSLRYQWTPSTVKSHLIKAQAFIAPQSVKAYETAIRNLVEFSTQKSVEQRVYPGKITVSLEKNSISISGDRITSIQGIRAAGSLNLELAFESGPRTKENPWGVYITREKEAQ